MKPNLLDLDPRVKEAGNAVGNRVTIYRQNVTRAKVGFNVGKDARKVPFRRKRTSRGGVGIGPANVHWFIAGTGERMRYGNQGVILLVFSVLERLKKAELLGL